MVIDALKMLLNLTKHFSLLMAYSIIISTSYLLGYWGSFDINIFEYIEISDILKMSIYSLMHLFNFGRHLVSVSDYRDLRQGAIASWKK